MDKPKNSDQNDKEQRQNSDLGRRDFHSSQYRGRSQRNQSFSSLFPVFQGDSRPKPAAKTRKKTQSSRPRKRRPPQKKENEDFFIEDDVVIVDSKTEGRMDEFKKKSQGRSVSVNPVMIIVVSLFGLLIFALLSIFVFFKVDNIEIVGDTIYSKDEIVKVCEYNLGDNLFFLSITDKEEKLTKELPYIASADIERKIPGTIIINLEEAKPGAVFKKDGQYVRVDDQGKILEINAENWLDNMQIIGAEIENPVASQKVSITDSKKNADFYEILAALTEYGSPEQIDWMDLTDVQNITMMYQSRIYMVLGNSSKLSYKIKLGMEVMNNPSKIREYESGKLDLSLEVDNSKAFFDLSYQISDVKVGGGGNGSSPSNNAPVVEAPFAQNPGRGSDIPDTPYKGANAASNDLGSSYDSGGSGTSDNNGDTADDNGDGDPQEDDDGVDDLLDTRGETGQTDAGDDNDTGDT